jgi:hypothetical protein
VEEIEASWGANHKQPPSMNTSVAVPLEVWVVQEPNSYAYPTIFYKTPQVLPCDSVIRLPLLDEAERLIKRKNKKGKNKIQPKFGLGYVHDDSTTSEDEGVNDP